MSGPLDFTGQNIEDSYQRVLQTDGSLVYDGTGSLVPITASYVNPLNQNVEITGSLNTSGSINLNGVDLNSLMIAYSIALG
jgi:hypothetical protein